MSYYRSDDRGPRATRPGARFSPRSVLGGNGDTFQDNMLAVFEYPKATATVKSSGVEVEGFLRRQFTVCGTEGTFHIQPLDKPSVTLSLSKERTFGGSLHVLPERNRV